MTYRIKMYCTGKDELMFNNKKIDKRAGNDIIMSLLPDDNIKEIFILHKNKTVCKNRFYIKSIEFACDSLTEQEFISFIEKMQQAGFYSLWDSNIRFIDKNVTVYDYSFQTIQKQHIVKREYKRNTSSYIHVCLYKKNIKGIICD
jgi:hypothetical protein